MTSLPTTTLEALHANYRAAIRAVLLSDITEAYVWQLELQKIHNEYRQLKAKLVAEQEARQQILKTVDFQLRIVKLQHNLTYKPDNRLVA